MSMSEYLDWAARVSSARGMPARLDRVLERAAQHGDLTADEYDGLCLLAYGADSTWGSVRRLSLLHHSYEQAQHEAARLAVFLDRPGQLGTLMASLDKRFPEPEEEWTREQTPEEREADDVWKLVSDGLDELRAAMERVRKAVTR